MKEKTKVEIKYTFEEHPFMYVVTYNGETEYFKTLRGMVSYYDVLNDDDVPYLHQHIDYGVGFEKVNDFDIKKVINETFKETSSNDTKEFGKLTDALTHIDQLVLLFSERGFVFSENKKDPKKYLVEYHLTKKGKSEQKTNPVKLKEIFVGIRKE